MNGIYCKAGYSFGETCYEYVYTVYQKLKSLGCSGKKTPDTNRDILRSMTCMYQYKTKLIDKWCFINLCYKQTYKLKKIFQIQEKVFKFIKQHYFNNKKNNNKTKEEFENNIFKF